MIPPVLVTPPAALPVDVASVKVALAISHGEHDAMIYELIAAAVGMLDGWGGQLNRCILPQTWRVAVIGPGPHLLPLTDVQSAVSSSGEAVALRLTARGYEATVGGAVGAHDIDFTCALPAGRLAAARHLVRSLVGYWYEQRLPVVGSGDAAATLTPVQRELIAGLRWDGP